MDWWLPLRAAFTSAQWCVRSTASLPRSLAACTPSATSSPSTLRPGTRAKALSTTPATGRRRRRVRWSPSSSSRSTISSAKPARVAGAVTRRGRLSMDAEDTYSLQMELVEGGNGSAHRGDGVPADGATGWAAGDNGYIAFSLTDGTIDRFLPGGSIDSRSYL